MVAIPHSERVDVNAAAVKPILQPGQLFWMLAALFGLIIFAGGVAYMQQFREGLEVTGLNQRVTWGFYISDMVFFIGISYGGALTSAILRLTGAPWRAPLTRMAEAMAVVSLVIGGLFPIIDLGRPENMMNLFLYGQVGSPVLWDVVAISTYMATSMVFFYLPLIPDLAYCRDHLGPAAGRLRHIVYSRLSLNWRGTSRQKRLLEQNMTIIAIAIIPLAVSVHSVLSWLFGVTLRPGWNSTIFGPYFVLGAMYSGVAAVILVLAGFRKAYHLEAFIGAQHFKNLANILLVLGVGYGYFMFAELLTEGYKMDGFVHEEGPGALLHELMQGRYAALFWSFVTFGLFIPVALISIPKTRTIPGIAIASTLIVVGMWLKRVIIVVPSMAAPIMPVEWATYWPSKVEVAITLAAAAAIPLGLMLFFRIFPIISIYEMEEAAEAEAHRLAPHPAEEAH
jgi:molybdopterin-containing oxidoreductase family membrane subunit